MKENYFDLCDRQYDATLDQVEGLERYPWVGSKFANSDCRPLLIGDSHYAIDDNKNFSQEAYEEFKDKDSTRRIVDTVIKNKCKGESTWKMYEGLLSTFIEMSPENTKAFWSKVAFYNFIQKVMKSIDEKPTDDDKRNGWRCLAGVIKVLKPTSILIIGVRNDGGSNSINDDEIKLEDFKDDMEHKVNNCVPRIGKIILKSHSTPRTIPLTLIKHTSQRYSHNLWKDYLRIRDPQLMDYMSK